MAGYTIGKSCSRSLTKRLCKRRATRRQFGSIPTRSPSFSSRGSKPAHLASHHTHYRSQSYPELAPLNHKAMGANPSKPEVLRSLQLSQMLEINGQANVGNLTQHRPARLVSVSVSESQFYGHMGCPSPFSLPDRRLLLARTKPVNLLESPLRPRSTKIQHFWIASSL